VTITFADIDAARRMTAHAVLRTPTLPTPELSAMTGAQIYVKHESLQVTNSVKERGSQPPTRHRPPHQSRTPAPQPVARHWGQSAAIPGYWHCDGIDWSL